MKASLCLFFLWLIFGRISFAQNTLGFGDLHPIPKKGQQWKTEGNRDDFFIDEMIEVTPQYWILKRIGTVVRDENGKIIMGELIEKSYYEIKNGKCYITKTESLSVRLEDADFPDDLSYSVYDPLGMRCSIPSTEMPYIERYSRRIFPLEESLEKHPALSSSKPQYHYDYLNEYRLLSDNESIATRAGIFQVYKYEVVKKMKDVAESEFHDWLTTIVWYSPKYGTVKEHSIPVHTPFIKRLFGIKNVIETEMVSFQGFD